jgi:hypothetical protein
VHEQHNDVVHDDPDSVPSRLDQLTSVYPGRDQSTVGRSVSSTGGSKRPLVWVFGQTSWGNKN